MGRHRFVPTNPAIAPAPPADSYTCHSCQFPLQFSVPARHKLFTHAGERSLRLSTGDNSKLSKRKQQPMKSPSYLRVAFSWDKKVPVKTRTKLKLFGDAYRRRCICGLPGQNNPITRKSWLGSGYEGDPSCMKMRGKTEPTAV